VSERRPGPAAAEAWRGDLPAEAALAVACLRADLESDGGGFLATALNREIDWERLVRFSLDHAITERVFLTLCARRPAGVPETVLDAAAQRLQRRRHEAKAAQAQLLTLTRLLEDRRIPVLAFKGPALSELLHGDAAIRSYRDLDFLVPPELARASLAALVASGYRRVHALTPAQDDAFVAYAGEDILYPADHGPLPIEPHWAFAPHTLAIDLDYAAIWRRSEGQAAAGAAARALAAEDLLIALCIHGGKEEWIRLQWICDVAVLLHRSPSLDWAVVLERSRRHGCRRMVLLGLALARDLLGSALPAAVTTALDRDPAAERLATRLAQLLFIPRDVPSIYAITRLRLAMRERWGDQLRYVWRTVTTPRVQHFRAVALPDRWFPAYRAVKLLHDYLLLPLWLLVKPLAGRRPPIESATPPGPGRTG
jgi:hypothetical protein